MARFLLLLHLLCVVVVVVHAPTALPARRIPVRVSGIKNRVSGEAPRAKRRRETRERTGEENEKPKSGFARENLEFHSDSPSVSSSEIPLAKSRVTAESPLAVE